MQTFVVAIGYLGGDRGQKPETAQSIVGWVIDVILWISTIIAML